MHAYQLNGIMPYDTKVAILGRGNTARGAQRILIGLGADVHVYNRSQEKLFQKEIWDTSREDHLIHQSDLKRFKPGTMFIDVSCDEHGAIETTVPTSLDDPIYEIDSVIHYAVDHTPTIFYRSASSAISTETVKYIDDLIESRPNVILKNALIIEQGHIMDKRITQFQNRSVSDLLIESDRPDPTSMI